MSNKAIRTFGLLVASGLLVVGCSKRTVSIPEEPAGKTAMAPRADLPTLVSALADEDADVRFAAVIDLGGYRPEAGSPNRPLGELLEDKAAPAVESLGKLLKDPSANMRSAAADTLGLIGPASASTAAPLGEALADPNPDVRRSAAVALGRIGAGAGPAVDALGKAVLDFDEEVRLAAIDALGKIGPSARSAVAVLLRAMGDGDEVKRRRALNSIQQIDPTAIARAPG